MELENEESSKVCLFNFQFDPGLLRNILYCPAAFSHFSPAPVKTDRVARIQ